MKMPLLLVMFTCLITFNYLLTGSNHRSISSIDKADEFGCVRIVAAFAGQLSHEKQKLLAKNVSEISNSISSVSNTIRGYFELNLGDIDKIVAKNDQLINDLSRLFKLSGATIDVKSGTVKRDGKEYAYNYLVLTDLEKSKSGGLRRIGRHTKRANVKTVEVDIFGNSVMRRGGYFRSSEKKISLSKNSVLSLLGNDLPDYIFKHEGTHAYFKGQRITNPTSVFHTAYKGANKKEFYNKGIYKSYVSMEELYNYANNLFWSTDSIIGGKFLKRSNSDIIGDFRLFFVLLDQLDEMATETQFVAEMSTKGIESLKKTEMPLFMGSWGPLGVDSFGVEIAPGIVTIRVPLPEDIETLKNAQKFSAFIKEYDLPNYVNNKNWNIDVVPEELRKQFLELYRPVIEGENRFLNRFIEQDKKIISLSNKLKEKSTEVRKQLRDLTESYQRFKKGDLSEDEMNQLLIDFGRASRSLGMIVRMLPK